MQVPHETIGKAPAVATLKHLLSRVDTQEITFIVVKLKPVEM